MAKGRKAVAQQAKAAGQVAGETRKHTVVNIARVPKLENGAWAQSNKGNLLFDVLCFPHNMKVEVKRPKGKPSASDHSKYSVELDGKAYNVPDAVALAIGTGYVKMLDGTCLMVYDADGNDAIAPDLKREVIRANQRKSAIRKGNTACAILASIAKMQGLANVFTPEEKTSYFNAVASLVNEMKVNLFKIAQDTGKKEKPVYISL